MAEAPKVIIIEASSGSADILTDASLTTILLGEFADGPSLNGDGVLMRITDASEIVSRLGGYKESNHYPDTVRAFLEMSGANLLVGRLVGTGGAKASVVINDLAGSPAPTIQFEWRGQGARPSVSGAAYKIRVSRGSKSTTDTGVGRVDTKYELLDGSSTLVPGAVIESAVMNPDSENYAVGQWNSLGVLCKAIDAAPSDSYEIADEPAVGTYSFAGGADPAAAGSTQRQAGADALDAAAVFHNATVGVVGWPSADVNYLVAIADAHQSTVVSHLAQGATSGTASSHIAGITAGKDSVYVTRGWGIWYRNLKKWIPGIAQVLAYAIIAAERGGGLAVNATGANEAEGRWVDFETVSAADINAFAAARANPLYWVDNDYQTGVIIGDVLTLEPGRYAQWGVRRADNQIYTDIVAYLNNRVKLKGDRLFSKKVAGQNTDRTLDTFNLIDGEIEELFRNYPATLLDGGRGVGWEWTADGNNTSDGFEPIFELGTSPAGVARILTVRVGAVDGRFKVQKVSVNQGGVA